MIVWHQIFAAMCCIQDILKSGTALRLWKQSYVPFLFLILFWCFLWFISSTILFSSCHLGNSKKMIILVATVPDIFTLCPRSLQISNLALKTYVPWPPVLSNAWSATGLSQVVSGGSNFFMEGSRISLYNGTLASTTCFLIKRWSIYDWVRKLSSPCYQNQGSLDLGDSQFCFQKLPFVWWGTPPVHTMLAQSVGHGRAPVHIEVVSHGGFDFFVKLAYDPTEPWQKFRRLEKWCFFFFSNVVESIVAMLTRLETCCSFVFFWYASKIKIWYEKYVFDRS